MCQAGAQRRFDGRRGLQEILGLGPPGARGLDELQNPTLCGGRRQHSIEHGAEPVGSGDDLEILTHEREQAAQI